MSKRRRWHSGEPTTQMRGAGRLAGGARATNVQCRRGDGRNTKMATESSPESAADLHVPARLAEAGLGGWLMVSAYLWPHSEAEFLDASLTGVALFVLGMLAWLRAPWLRWANMLLAM